MACHTEDMLVELYIAAIYHITIDRHRFVKWCLTLVAWWRNRKADDTTRCSGGDSTIADTASGPADQR